MRLVRRIALELLGPEKGRLVWQRMDVIGDIAVLKLPLHGAVGVEELRLIAERIVEEVPSIRSVWLQTGKVGGAYRLRGGLVHLAGEKRTTTLYREHGCSFHVDIAEVFVTPRLSFEHIRVARLVGAGERVLNMFAGAGIFSVIIARHARPSKVYSVDINPKAYEMMRVNARLNRVSHIVEPILGDAARVVEERLAGSSDRVLLPLPSLALEYLPHALKALRGGEGWLHVYLHIDYERGRAHVKRAGELVKRRLEDLGWHADSIGARVVRSVGPRLDQVVVDVLARRG